MKNIIRINFSSSRKKKIGKQKKKQARKNELLITHFGCSSALHKPFAPSSLFSLLLKGRENERESAKKLSTQT